MSTNRLEAFSDGVLAIIITTKEHIRVVDALSSHAFRKRQEKNTR